MQDVMSRQTLGLRVASTVFRIVAFQEGAMRQIHRACTAVLVSIVMIGTSGCGHGVHVHFNNGQTKVHVGSQDRTAGAQRDSAGRGTGRHR